ncbi:unnamed protein product [Clavelina lepadiformis]|uniref:Uncharacterized protein n=1 Tax=Clavelina lepadiformis TaxID=159417 RepID=A0ABP0FW31_CLALP
MNNNSSVDQTTALESSEYMTISNEKSSEKEALINHDTVSTQIKKNMASTGIDGIFSSSLHFFLSFKRMLLDHGVQSMFQQNKHLILQIATLYYFQTGASLAFWFSSRWTCGSLSNMA